MPRPRLGERQSRWAQELGLRLRRAREDLGLSRERVARQTPFSVETLRKIETGATRSPELFTVLAFAAVVSVDLDQLCAGLLEPAAGITEAP